MKITNSELLTSIPTLSKLAEKENLPIKFAYAIAKNIKTINDALEVYRDVKNKLVLKYVEQDEDGNPVKKNVKNPQTLFDQYEFTDREKFLDELNQILNEEVEVNIHWVSLEHFPETMSVPMLNSILFIVKEENE